MTNPGPKAAGCLITLSDLPRIYASFVVYGAMCGYGACIGVVGSAIPLLANELHVSRTSLGELFFYRGVGYFAGGLASAGVLSRYNSKDILSKELLVFLSIALSGIITVLLATTRNFSFIKALFILQGFGFGGVDTFGTIALSEMWGQRVQPWLQARTATFALGGIAGPVLLESQGLNRTFAMCGLLCMSSALGLLGGYMHSCCTSQQESDAETIPGLLVPVLSKLERFIQSLSTMAPSTSHDLLSSDLHRIEECLEEIDIRSVGSASDMEGAVHDILEETEFGTTMYSSYSENWAPITVNRTLSFATAKMTDRIHEAVEHPPIVLLPTTVTATLAMHMMLFFGLYYAFSGWVPTYVLVENISSIPSDGSFVATVYFTSMSLGSFLAIPMAVVLSTTTMMRYSLVLLCAGCVCIAFFSKYYTMLCISGALLGGAVSSMSPLILTISNDYGFTLDAVSTSAIVMGGTVGESFVPVIIGYFMSVFGGSAMIISFVLICASMVADYVYVHYRLSSLSSDIPVGHLTSCTTTPNSSRETDKLIHKSPRHTRHNSSCARSCYSSLDSRE
mmetsp:Transcript_4956/g.7571  ORF Transcript_4956/g.7571 Transcript_4956/m.7571 type:complete len:564 (-) Transcript_4956:141-1832(-)